MGFVVNEVVLGLGQVIWVLSVSNIQTVQRVHPLTASSVPRNFVRGGVQQIQLKTEDRENGGSGGGSPINQGFWKQL